MKRAGTIVGLLVWDIVFFVMAVLCYAGAFYAAAESYAWMDGLHVYAPLLWSCAVLTFLCALTAEIALLHRLFPKPRAGRHKLLQGIGFWGYALNLLLQRILFFGALRTVFHGTSVFRYLGYRALGAKIDFSVSTSIDALILDPSLTTIGPGTTLGARSMVSGHYIKDGHLILAEVVIGKDVLFAFESGCGPGVRIGDGTKVLSYGKLGPHAELGRNVVVGLEATVDAYVKIPDETRLGVREHRKRPPRDKAEVGES